MLVNCTGLRENGAVKFDFVSTIFESKSKKKIYKKSSCTQMQQKGITGFGFQKEHDVVLYINSMWCYVVIQ